MTQFGMPTLIEIESAEESAKLCHRLGLRFLELNMSFPRYQPERMDIGLLKSLKSRYGIYYTIHIDESLDPCNVNSEIARVYTDSMLRTIEIAKELEIPTLNMHLLRGVYVTLPGRRTYIYAENEDFYLDGLRRFRDKVTEAIGESGIKLCIENTDGYDQPFLRDALEVLLESPAVGLTLDVGHDHAIGGIDLPLILSNRDRLCHMHLHDAVGESVHLALGDGELDKERYLELAEDCGCRVVLETKTIEALGKSVMWINHWLNRYSEPDELWDVYDSARRATGRLHRRRELLAEGDYHLVVHVWMKNSGGQFLITRRAPQKGCGGMWESPGGSAVAGESSIESALREIEEETGLRLDARRGRVLKTYSRDHFICDVWLFEQDFELEDAVLLPGETTDIRYADSSEIKRLYDSGDFVPFEYLDELLGE